MHDEVVAVYYDRELERRVCGCLASMVRKLPRLDNIGPDAYGPVAESRTIVGRALSQRLILGGNF